MKRFQNNYLSGESVKAINWLTKFPLRSNQTSCGRHFNSGISPSCVLHNASNTGSSKLLQQRANETAVAFASDATSSCARNLVISSTLRQGCMSNLGGVSVSAHQTRGNPRFWINADIAEVQSFGLSGLGWLWSQETKAGRPEDVEVWSTEEAQTDS